MPLLFIHTFIFALIPPLLHALNVRAPTSPITVPLSGGLLHTSGFYFNATVGAQSLTLQVDTSYSSLIVPRKGCVGCRVGDRRYDPKKSASVVTCTDPRCQLKTSTCPKDACFGCSSDNRCCTSDAPNCAFNMFYGDGSSGNGTLFEDDLVIDGRKARILFGAMHEESHNFELPYADGVLGLAMKEGACHPTCIPPAMDAFTNGTGIKNVFTMCVSRFGGTLVLGDAARSLANHEYQYMDLDAVTADKKYIVPAQSEWKIGDRVLSVPGITQAMWTVGTSDIGVSKTTFLALITHLNEHYCHIDGLCTMTSWFRPQRCEVLEDEIVAQMPNITMGLSKGVSITLTPDDYLIKYRVLDGKMTRCVAFIATDGLAGHGIGLLLGATVMRRYAVVFDREKKRIGIASANQDKCGPINGTIQGMPGGRPDPEEQILTADAPKVPGVEDIRNDTNLGKTLMASEKCRAETTCSGCAKLEECAYGYQTGRCVIISEGGKRPYPYCSGIGCACFAVGVSGWYVGIGIGVGIVGGIVAIMGLVWRKRRRGTQYQMVEQYEEQDLETF